MCERLLRRLRLVRDSLDREGSEPNLIKKTPIKVRDLNLKPGDKIVTEYGQGRTYQINRVRPDGTFYGVDTATDMPIGSGGAAPANVDWVVKRVDK